MRILGYRRSNPVFDKIVANTAMFLQENIIYPFKDFDFSLIMTFLICLFISVFIFMRTANQQIIEIDENTIDELERKKKIENQGQKINALKNEYMAGVFLFAVLNLIILVLNYTDIRWVWFGFEWEGQYLKQFVHEGTYLLILSIITSIVLVLYYFRGNLNFYSNNKLLKYLSIIWLFQNGILSISVAIRNFWYISYFALAYKRIGVFIFLILTLYGLYTVFIKVQQKKSAFYLVKRNTFAILLVLIFSSLFNWDTIIAKYNFAHSDRSFLHLDYMSNLSDKSLPYLDKPLKELKYIDSIQKEKFPFEQEFMTPEEYVKIIDERKRIFAMKWESKSILSWNLPEYRAYQKLKMDSRTEL
ncbi:MAG: DUF4173 domain-containing protein [Cryomorphaceae bacterium]|nr:DUF4173 domain-containing protein [Cryomorphaceae bacterium]